jgi:guanosine-3',5'-bis(diphosphate) 3'-pyrophosphohydrolase
MNDTSRLLIALHFSADRHRHQRRKDRSASPYINHPIEVATVLATVGGVADLTTLIAALLHDTIEDTATTGEELEQKFGREVRLLVEEMTDDKRLPRGERKRAQIEHALHASHRAKLVKLGDKICNVRDVTHAPPDGWSVERRREYLDWTEQVVAGCRGASAALERHYDQLLAEGQRALNGAS